MALSQKFVWVEINRDHGGKPLCNRFSINAYPALIVFGDKDEKVHRFHGFKKPVEFLRQLKDGLRRHALYKAGKEWDEPLKRPLTICRHGTVETFPAPSEGSPSGLTVLKGDFWVAQQGELFRLSATGEQLGKFKLPPSVRDICTDGTLLYGMEYGWTAGRPIHVIDPKDGKVLREIVTEKNKENRSMGAAGLAWKDGKLYVLAGMHGKISEVDPKTGEVARVLDTGVRWLSGLDYDGKHFVAGSREALHFLDAETGKEIRRVLVNYPLRVVASHGGAFYLFEQAIFGHDKQHKRVRVFPKRVAIHKLTLPR